MGPYGPQYPAQNPYAPPQAQIMPAGHGTTPMSARVDGTSLVVPNGSAFPPVCLKCAATQGISWRDQKFTYVPPWARLFGALIQVFVMKRSRFQLPLCQPCLGTWKKWNLYMWLAIVPPILLCIFGGVLGAAIDGDLGGTLAAISVTVGILGFLVGLIVVAIQRRKAVVMAFKIDKQFSWLRGIHANALPAILGGGQPMPAMAPAYAPAPGYPPQGGYPPPGYPPQGGYGPPR